MKSKQICFLQGDAAEAVFYIRKGTAELTVVSKADKEATITLPKAGDFVCEEAITIVVGLRLPTAISSCITLRIERKKMIRVMHDEHEFLDLFVASC